MIELVNSAVLTAQLLAIPEKIRVAVERKAVDDATKLIVGTLRQNAPAETGALAKSFNRLIRGYQSGRVLVGLAGADYGYVGSVVRNKKGKKVFKRNNDAAAGNRRRPAKYLHLVTLGTQMRQTQAGQNRGSVIGQDFVKQTQEQLTGQIQQIFTDAVQEALN